MDGAFAPTNCLYADCPFPHLLYILYHIFCIDANRRIIFLLNFLLSGAWRENFARAPEFRAFARGCWVAGFYVFKKIK